MASFSIHMPTSSSRPSQSQSWQAPFFHIQEQAGHMAFQTIAPMLSIDRTMFYWWSFVSQAILIVVQCLFCKERCILRCVTTVYTTHYCISHLILLRVSFLSESIHALVRTGTSALHALVSDVVAGRMVSALMFRRCSCRSHVLPMAPSSLYVLRTSLRYLTFI